MSKVKECRLIKGKIHLKLNRKYSEMMIIEIKMVNFRSVGKKMDSWTIHMEVLKNGEDLTQ